MYIHEIITHDSYSYKLYIITIQETDIREGSNHEGLTRSERPPEGDSPGTEL